MRVGMRFAGASVLLVTFTSGCACAQKQWGWGTVGGAIAGAAAGATATVSAQNNTGAFDIGSEGQDRALAWATGIIAGGALGALLGHCLLDDTMAEPAPPPPPPAPAPTPVVQQKIVLRGVNFDFDKSNIRPDAVPVLKEAAQILKSNPTVKVSIEGHTDSVGTEEYNLRLSARRADAVKKFLVGEGVEESRLTTRGLGEANPVASNDTADGRAQNRRVELKVL